MLTASRPAAAAAASARAGMGCRQPRRRVAAAAVDDVKVSGLPQGEVCDDFVCTSSPAVGAAIKTVARDIEACSDRARSLGVYADKVEYSEDGGLALEGKAALEGYKPVSDLLEGAKAVVTEMEMVELDTCRVAWTLEARPKGAFAAAGEVKARGETMLEFNLISGRVTKETLASLDASESAPAAGAYFSAARALYSATKGLSAKVGGSSGDGGKGGDATVDDMMAAGNDPAKFFMGGQEDDMKDVYDFLLVLAILYALVQGLRAVL